MSYCQNCGAEVLNHRNMPHGSVLAKPASVPPLGRRIATILYVCAYLILIVFSIGVAQSINQYFTAPDPASSYIACKDGPKVPYKLLGIRNPTTDPAHDDILIDAACRNLGGNTYTNILRTGPKATAWEYGLAVFVLGLILIEIMKGTLVYLIRGYFPGFGALGRR